MTIDLATMEALVRDTLGSSSHVRARRPRLYQIGVPAFHDDGDGADVFVQVLRDGRLTVGDLGATTMRLSYSGEVDDADEEVLSSLAEAQGFTLNEGELAATVELKELPGAVLGLVQVEAQAEAAIRNAVLRRESAVAFRDAVRGLLLQIFGDRCTIGYTDPEVDPLGDYAIDALVSGQHALGVYVLGQDLETDRALNNKTKLDPVIVRRFPARRWVVVPRPSLNLSNRSKRKLDADNFYIAPSETGAMAARLKDLGS